MNRVIRAEARKLRRPGLALALAVLPLLSIIATAAVVLSATQERPQDGPGTSLVELSRAGGLTQGFASTSVFLGLLFFALFAFTYGSEHSGGTLRAMLVREPRRLRLLTGKWLVLAAVVAATLLVALAGSALTAALLAPSQNLDTSEWLTGAGIRAGCGDYLDVLLAALFYGTAGASVATLLRSGSLAVGAGLVWLGPVEHLLSDGWDGGQRWFPGLVFEGLAQGGTMASPLGRSLMVGGFFVAVSAVAGSLVFARRDVTG